MTKEPTKPMNLHTLLTALKAKGFMPKHVNAKEFIENPSLSRAPIYVHILLFFSALISTFFFIFFLFLLRILSNSSEFFILLGIVFIIGAIALYRSSNAGNSTAQIFLQQISLVVIITGKIFFVIGFYGFFEDLYYTPFDSWIIPLMFLISTVCTYSLYSFPLERFISSCCVLFSTLIYLFNTSFSYFWTMTLLHTFFFIQLGILAFVFLHDKSSYGKSFHDKSPHDKSSHVKALYNKVLHGEFSKQSKYIPVAYACIFSIAITILIFTPYPDNFFGTLYTQGALYLSSINILFVCALLFLLFKIVGDWRAMLRRPLVVLVATTILLGFVSTTGILFSLILLGLGHAKQNRLISSIGSLFLITFLTTYYFYLDLTLLQKSATLVGTGLMLLLARYFILRQDRSIDTAMNTAPKEPHD